MTEPLLSALHSRTPALVVLESRGAAIRSLVYHRGQAEAEVLDERISLTTYTASGAVETQTDSRFFTENSKAAAVTNNFRYGSALSGKVLHTFSVDSGETENLFDIEGRLCWSADSRGTTTQQDYDILGRLTTVTEQHKGCVAVTERLIYADTASAFSSQDLAVDDGKNVLGQLICHLDPAGVVTTDSYSLAGAPLVQARQLLANDNSPVNWPEFKSFSELSEVSPTAYRTHWQRDSTGEMIVQWDAKGNRQRFSYSVAAQLNSSYLTQATQVSEQIIVSQIQYTAVGQVLEETAGNGMRTRYTYESETQRLSRISSTRPSKTGRPTLLQDLRYAYDPVGNILKIDDQAQPIGYFANQKTSAQRQYTYDTLYQLIAANGREDAKAGLQIQALPELKTPLPQAADGQLVAYTRVYQYDRGGNLTHIRHKGAHSYTRTIGIDEGSNRATVVHSQAEGRLLQKEAQPFDARGNLLALRSGQKLSWNPRNQLSQAVLLERATGENDEERYVYGSDGMRVRKTTIAKGKASAHPEDAIYLPGLELRVQNNGKEVLNVILIGKAGRCQVRVLYWDRGKPESIENSQLRYSLDDHIGSTAMELDAQADKLSEEEYYPYGGTALLALASAIEVKYKYVRYSGKERDATGLYYYGYRYYVPWTGRWLNPDPASVADGFNLYCFVRNNPITLYDPDGLSASDVLIKQYKGIQKIGSSAKTLRGNLEASDRQIWLKALGNIAVGPIVYGSNKLLGWAAGYIKGGLSKQLASSTMFDPPKRFIAKHGGKYLEDLFSSDLLTHAYAPQVEIAKQNTEKQNIENQNQEKYPRLAKLVEAVSERHMNFIESSAETGANIALGLATGGTLGVKDIKTILSIASPENPVITNVTHAEQLIYYKGPLAQQAYHDANRLLEQVNFMEKLALHELSRLSVDKRINSTNPSISFYPSLVSSVPQATLSNLPIKGLAKEVPSAEKIIQAAQTARSELRALRRVGQKIGYNMAYRIACSKVQEAGFLA